MKYFLVSGLVSRSSRLFVLFIVIFLSFDNHVGLVDSFLFDTMHDLFVLFVGCWRGVVTHLGQPGLIVNLEL